MDPATSQPKRGWPAPSTSLRRVDTGERLPGAGAHEDNEEGATVAVEVVAASARSGTEHSSGPATAEWIRMRVHVVRQLGKTVMLARDGVPDDKVVPRTVEHEIPGRGGVEEDAAMARVDGLPLDWDSAGQGDGGGGDKARTR